MSTADPRTAAVRLGARLILPAVARLSAWIAAVRLGARLTPPAAVACLAAFALAAVSAVTSTAADRNRGAQALPGDGPRPVVAQATAGDPPGDTFGNGAVQVDLLSFAAEVEGADLVVGMTFAAPVTLPDAPGDAALTGYVDLDVDQDGDTGNEGFVDFFSPYDSGLGIEYYVDLGSYDSETGTMEVIDDGNATIAGAAAATFSAGATALEIRIPAAVLADDGAVHTAVVAGTALGPTDAAPNGGLVTSGPGPNPGAVLLNNDRFAVEIEWRDFFGNTGIGQLAVRSDDSANFWFFNPNNWELLIKVLDGCATNDRYWVFLSAVTTVEYTVTVHDTQSQVTRTYTNDLGETPTVVTDTAAFDTCP